MKQTDLRKAVKNTALVLAAGLLMGLLIGCPQNGASSVGGNTTIFKTDGKGIITGYTCKKEELPSVLIIPDKIGNEVITGIGVNAFYYCKNIESVYFPQGLTKIRKYAFRWCLKLSSVSFPESLTTIEHHAFDTCIELTSIKLPQSLTTIEHHAFGDCEKLSSVEIPSKVETIDGGAFAGCINLKTLTVDKDNEKYKSEGNIIYTKDMKTLVQAAGSLTEVSIPKNVTSIANNAFAGCKNLTKVSFNESITSINGWAFQECSNLTSVELPSKLKTLGTYAFSICEKAEIKLHENIQTIGKNAFGWNDDSFCKKVLIKKGAEFERIKKLVKDSRYPEDRIGER